MDVTLFRHTSVAVPSGTCYGRSDVPVSDNFENEAEGVKRQISGIRFDAVYSSPLTRCRKLAAWCGYENPILDDRLLEINCGDWEMQRWDEIDDPRLAVWFENWLDFPAGGGESFRQQIDRVAGFLNELKTRPFEKVCIFAHGGILRCALIYSGQLEPQGAFSPELPYCHKIPITI